MIIAALVRCRLHPAPTQQTLLSASSPSSDDDKLMLQGDYAVVRSLVRVVEGGKEAKAAADKARKLAPLPARCRCVAADVMRVLAGHRPLRAYAKPAGGDSGVSPRAGSRGARHARRLLAPLLGAPHST
jgi:hypothetical protein